MSITVKSLVFLSPLMALCTASSIANAAPCNGSEDLCDRGYDEVSYVTTHNAFNAFLGDVHYWFANQAYPIDIQLSDGVRGLMLDIHEYNGFDDSHDSEVWTCHSFCWLGGAPLVDSLVDIRLFMDENPNEVLTIIFESYVPREQVEDIFREADLLKYTHTQDINQPWPTLQEMIDADERLVVLTDRDGGSSDWYLNVWNYAVETHYSAQQPEDLSCDYNRGDASNSLFIFNHFLTYPLARRSLSYQVNHNPFLLDRSLECQNETGKLPNFVTVDYYNIGDVSETVDFLNNQ